MSDDLKTRLRWAADSSDGCGEWNCDPADLYAAADRIEELEAKLNWVLVERDETFALILDRAQTAEAKLAKVISIYRMEALRRRDYIRAGDRYIAELTGGKKDE